MKAVLMAAYGPPDALRISEVATPIARDADVLVRVRAASVNPLDWHRMRGRPLFARIGEGMRRPKDPRLGADLAGVVEGVGASAERFRVGDEVFGSLGAGTFAEYVVAPERAITLKPESCSFEEAAATPLVGFTALQGVRDKGRVRAGQRVLVNGASGGVGGAAVQIAKAFDAEVTGVTSTRNLDRVLSMGADHVIDYMRADFSRGDERYDLIYDAVGNRSVFDYRRALAPDGRCVIAGFTRMSRLLQHAVVGPTTSRSRRVALQGVAKPNPRDLEVLRGMLEARTLAPVIDRRFTLDEISDAIAYLETGHARGKVVITVT